MSKLLKQSLLYSIGEVIPKMVGFFLLPIYTYYLSKADYGILSYTNSFMLFLFALSILSLNTFVLRCYFDQKSEEAKKRLIGSAYLAIGFANLLISLVFYFALPVIVKKYNIQVPWEPYFKLALINNFLEVFSVIPLVMYRVKQQAKVFVLLNLSKTLLQMLLTFLLIVVFKWGLLGHYYGRLFALVPFFFIYWGVMFKNVKLNINIPQLRKGLVFALPLLPGALAYLVLDLSDRLVLERFVTISDIGVYSLAYTLAFTLNIVIQGFYKAVEPEIFKRFGTNSFNIFIKRTQNRFFFVLYLGAMTITLFSQEVFYVMASAQFYRGYLLIPILMIGVIMVGQNVIFGGIIIAEKKTKVMGVAAIIGAIVNLLFNVSFMKYGGIYIAAISTALSFGVMNVILYYRMSYSDKSLRESLWALLFFILISFILFYVIGISTSFTGILIKFALLLVYCTVIFKVFGMSRKDFVKIQNQNCSDEEL